MKIPTVAKKKWEDMTPEEKQKLQYIEIDCPPGPPRPGDLIESVIKDTGLPSRETVSRFYGNWTWDYKDIPLEVWEKARPILKKRLTKLYKQNIARYVSW